MAVIPISPDGKFKVYNHSGSVDVVVDVLGWYDQGVSTTGDRYASLVPARIFDTRPSNSPLGANQSRDVQVAGVGGVPSSGVTAVVVNLTVTGPTAPSFLTAWPTGTVRPLASNLNYVSGQTVPNLAILKVGSGGRISVYNAAGSAHVVIDVLGWYHG
jgi:hypothetical protein